MSEIVQIEVQTHSRQELVDISDEVSRTVKESGVMEGACHVFVPHTTAALTIGENWDPTVAQDTLATLEVLVPLEAKYHHREGNAPAHVKASLLGSSQTLLVSRGRLLLGRWQGILLCEFDGPRRRRVLVKVVEG